MQCEPRKPGNGTDYSTHRRCTSGLGGNLRSQRFERISPHNDPQHRRPAWLSARGQAVRYLQHADYDHPRAVVDQRDGADGSTMSTPARGSLHGLLHGSQLGCIRHG